MPDKIAILKVKNLVKKYGNDTAVNSVSFEVHAGEIVGLLGPNGAGKTTTINMILGVLDQTSGSVEILGKTRAQDSEIMSQVNFAAVYASVPANLTVRQNLNFFGMLYGVKNLPAKINSLLDEFTLRKFENTKVGLLSSGEQTRVSLAKAVINKPKLLLLDEPTASLDPSAAHLIRDKVRHIATEKNTAILWTSHNMHEVEAVCDRVLFFSHGEILLQGDPKTLPAQYGKKNLEELFITSAREPLSLELE